MANLSDLVNPDATKILHINSNQRVGDRYVEANLYDNGPDWPEGRYIVTGPLNAIFAVYTDLREAVADWADNAAKIKVKS